MIFSEDYHNVSKMHPLTPFGSGLFLPLGTSFRAEGSSPGAKWEPIPKYFHSQKSPSLHRSVFVPGVFLRPVTPGASGRTHQPTPGGGVTGL